MSHQILAQVDLEFSAKTNDESHREESLRKSLALILEVAARRVMQSEIVKLPECGRLTLAVETDHLDQMLVLDIVERVQGDEHD